MKRIFIFLILNFAALGLGGIFTSEGVPSDWYVNLVKAPWTPPGWVFGAAWTTIMICFAFYMAYAWSATKDKKLISVLYGVQLVLNVAWSPIFFKFHLVFSGLLVISLLTCLVGFILLYYHSTLKLKSTLLLPYFVWLLIATSLNAFVLMYN